MESLSVTLKPLDEKVKFSATARENPQVVIDYFPPVGTGQGYTSLELLMASFGSCISTALATLLRHKMQKEVKSIGAEITGNVRDTHPKSLENINTTLTIKAKDLSEAEVQQALKVAEESICPVWAMLKGNVNIEITANITE